MDDFGIGYSSLALLRHLPIHYVKIDKSFVYDMSFNEEDEAIVNAIIAMSHSMKMKVVAEGVETREQLELLKKLKCDFIQGFYISRPLSADRFCSYHLENNFEYNL
jgi:EAL domain-containing protein (putative c-di-GMP-specific phosphodiesterase class I)